MVDLGKIYAWFRKSITRTDVLILLALLVFFIATRLYNILHLPIFNDEGIYIRWAKVAWHDAQWRFISLTDGKQPLQTWGTIPFLKMFPDNALLAGRLFSVATGLFGLVGMIALLYSIGNKKMAFLGGLLYVVSPYFLFYDRMAMVDSGVNAFFIWILFFSTLLARTIRLDVALLFGIVAGAGLLAKSSVQMLLSVAIILGVLWIPPKKRSFSYLLTYALLSGLSGAIAIIMYNVQRLSPFMHYVNQKNGTFVMTFSEWLANPFAVLMSNLRSIPTYVSIEAGIPLVCTAILGGVVLWRTNKTAFIYFFLLILIPFTGIALMTRVLFPRYIIFFGSLLTILSVYFLNSLSKKVFVWVTTALVALLMLQQSPMWFNYTAIRFPDIDRGQYITGQTVGLGAREIMEYARTQSRVQPVAVIAEGNFGMAFDVLDVFAKPGDTNMELKGFWPLNREEIEAFASAAAGKKIFVVSAHRTEFPADWPVKLIQRFDKTNKESSMLLGEFAP